MDKNEFEQRLKLVDSMTEQANQLRKELGGLINDYFTGSVEAWSNNGLSRDNDFRSYLDLLKEFNFDGGLTNPVDYFPGLRTVADSVDPEEMNGKTEKMKRMASDIQDLDRKCESQYQWLASTLKKTLKVISELQILETQIQDANGDILADLDSIYDVGRIASSTK